LSAHPQTNLTSKELSDRFGGRVSPGTIANWRVVGSGPEFIRIGGRIYYPLAKIIEWENRNTHTSTAEYCQEAR